MNGLAIQTTRLDSIIVDAIRTIMRGNCNMPRELSSKPPTSRHFGCDNIMMSPRIMRNKQNNLQE